MSYDHRFFIFVEANRVNQANNLAKNWDPDSGGDQTFGDVRLSADGNEPATHFGAATWATDTMRDGITNALGAIPWSSLYSTNPAIPNASFAASWEDALNDMNLIVIVTDPI